MYDQYRHLDDQSALCRDFDCGPNWADFLMISLHRAMDLDVAETMHSQRTTQTPTLRVRSKTPNMIETLQRTSWNRNEIKGTHLCRNLVMMEKPESAYLPDSVV